MRVADSQQSRRADALMAEAYAFPTLLLMEVAGRKCADLLLRLYPSRKTFIILCGPGNNGGDGYVIARRLWLSGKAAVVVLAHDSSSLKGDARIQMEILRKTPISVLPWNEERMQLLCEAAPDAVLVDALLGTGVKGEVKGVTSEVIRFFREKNLNCVAVDMPSGLSADSGRIHTAPIPAQHTVAFHQLKVCHVVTPASLYCGTLHVADIGIYPEVERMQDVVREAITSEWVKRNYRPRKKDSHKGSQGHLLVCGGSFSMSGAIALSGKAALHAGCGLVTAFVPGSARAALYHDTASIMVMAAGDEEQRDLHPHFAEEFIRALEGKAAVLLGPGMGTSADTAEFMRSVLPHVRVPLLMDADALNLLSADESLRQSIRTDIILTPHPGEMKRLSKNQDANEMRLEVAEAYAKIQHAIVVMKGAGTVIAHPDGQTHICMTGNAGMATGGTGDVLAGMIGSLLAQGYPPAVAAPLGVHLHGLAGDIRKEEVGVDSLTAEGMIACIGSAFLRALTPETQDISRI